MKLFNLLWINVFKHCKILILLIILSSSVYASALIPMLVQKTYIDKLQLFLTGEYAFIALIFWLVIFYITRSISGGFLIPLAAAKDLYYEYAVTRHVRRSQHKINNAIPLENFDSISVYNLMERAGQALTSGALRSTVNAIAALLTMSISFGSILISLYLIHYSLLFFAIILVVPIFIEYFWFQKKLYIIEKELVVTRRKQSFCLNHISSKEYFFQTRISDTSKYFVGEWEKYRVQTEKLYCKVQKNKLIFGLVSSAIKSGCIIGMIILALHFLSTNIISVGSFSVIIGIIGMLIGHMNFFIGTLSQSIVRVKELNEVSAYYDIPEEKTEKSPLSEIGDITLNNVSYKYESRETDAISNITKTFKKGEKIAILGINGAGKTTLTNIIMGLYSPSSGTVLYNGFDISIFDKNGWREKITAVFQDFQVHNLTISDNVFIGNTRKEKNDVDIVSSLNMASFPIDKYAENTMIGRSFDGAELSRGEAQKLACARSYYNSNAEIIVIDEPTAALDPIAEEKLYQSFINNSEDKTVFIISHRLGSVKIADRILVMESSKIVEDGTHKQLLSQNGIYAKMYENQAILYKR